MSRTGNYYVPFPNKARGFILRYRRRINTKILNADIINVSMVRPRRYFVCGKEFQVITQAI